MAFHPRFTVRTIDGESYAVNTDADWYTKIIGGGHGVGDREIRGQIRSGEGLPFVHPSTGKSVGVAFLSEESVSAVIAFEHWSHAGPDED